jgi:hypothetical protein
MSRTETHAAYERAAARWHADTKIDERFGTNYAAASLITMRKAYAAWLAVK